METITVQQLIDLLMKVEDKSLPVVYNIGKFKFLYINEAKIYEDIVIDEGNCFQNTSIMVGDVIGLS